MTDIIDSVFDRPRDAKLSVEELAEALYEGAPHLEFLMHNLARQYGDPKGMLPPWYAQNDQCKDLFRSVAILLVKYAISGGYKLYKEESESNGKPA